MIFSLFRFYRCDLQYPPHLGRVLGHFKGEMSSSSSSGGTTPETRMPAPQAIDPSCRVDDFINVFKLQNVMNSLVARLVRHLSLLASESSPLQPKYPITNLFMLPCPLFLDRMLNKHISPA